jgi:hypothetical protein
MIFETKETSDTKRAILIPIRETTFESKEYSDKNRALLIHIRDDI